MANKRKPLAREDLEHIGSLITLKSEPDACLGYLMPFKDHGVFDAEYGKLPITEAECSLHNAALDKAMLEGLQKCPVGKGGNFYYSKGRVTTFVGTVICEKPVIKGRGISLTWRGMQFSGRLPSGDTQMFFLERVA